jgi:hypothetical protein
MPLRQLPCLTIPMVTKDRRAMGSYIYRPYQEDTLLKMDLPLNKQQN